MPEGIATPRPFSSSQDLPLVGLFPGFVLDVVLNGKVVEFEPSARGFEVSQSLDTVEPLCCGHLGDLVKCPV